jgi:hypothetical protein
MRGRRTAALFPPKAREKIAYKHNMRYDYVGFAMKTRNEIDESDAGASAPLENKSG